jgi:serine protease Do
VAVLAASVPAAAPPPDKLKRFDREIDKTLQQPPMEILNKPAPESVEDLKAIQDHVKKVLKKVNPAVVGIIIGGSSGSGVIIDNEGHVLTAGHVSGKPGQLCTLILPNGSRLKGKSLGQNVGIDSGLIKITDKGPFPHVSLGDSTKVKMNQWVISIGHPGGFKPTRSPVVRLGRVLNSTNSLIRTDCTLVGGDSGGPLFNMHGQVVGIHSRIGFSIAENVHVPVNTYKETWERLVKADSWGGWEMPFFNRKAGTAYLGVVFDSTGGTLKIGEVGEGTPAEKAGLKVGDVIVAMDDTKVGTRGDLFDFMQKKKPNDEVTVVVNRDGAEKKVKVKLGRRPAD